MIHRNNTKSPVQSFVALSLFARCMPLRDAPALAAPRSPWPKGKRGSAGPIAGVRLLPILPEPIQCPSRAHPVPIQCPGTQSEPTQPAPTQTRTAPAEKKGSLRSVLSPRCLFLQVEQIRAAIFAMGFGMRSLSTVARRRAIIFACLLLRCAGFLRRHCDSGGACR